MLTIIDEYTRKVLCVAVRPKINANDMLDVLFDPILKRGNPEFVRSDNGPEFILEHLQIWLRKVGSEPIQIYPGSPWEYGGWRKQCCGTLFSRHMPTTSASIARYPMKNWTQNGSTLSIRRKLQSMYGSPPIQSHQTTSWSKYATASTSNDNGENENYWHRKLGLDSGAVRLV